ncbi:MAG TPA: hypothetical protein VIO58_04825 [Candidatus Methanoperedens sp.]
MDVEWNKQVSYLIVQARQKVKEGKLVKAEIEYDEGIRKVKITGDFFLHPEDTLEKIEQSMIGLKKDACMETIVHNIRRIAEAHDAVMIGIGPESLALVIKEALK